METTEAYLDRKRQETSLLDNCLSSPLHLKAPSSVNAAIEQKFRLAAAVRAERNLQNWSTTETARSSIQHATVGAFEFSYGYQRADLQVRSPPIYKALSRPSAKLFLHTIYTSSGMSAIAAVLTALSRMRESADLLIPRGCYGETRELIESFGSKFQILPLELSRRHQQPPRGIARIVLLDSSVRELFFQFVGMPAQDVDLVVFDTTCFWRNSGRIDRVVRWAMQSNLPLALVRSHSKLDCMGIEYGRLGSVVLATPQRSITRLDWRADLARQTAESVRLFGAAPVPASFPPFTDTQRFLRSSGRRIAAIIRNNRRMARALSTELGDTQVVTFQHGLYLTLVPSAELSIPAAKALAAKLSDELISSDFPVCHAGSFGFDFVAIEWFADPESRRNVVRISASDIPSSTTDEIARRVARFWLHYESPMVHLPYELAARGAA